MMTDKPIIFSGPMVRAIIDGRKTQTRRVLKPTKWQRETWNPDYNICPSARFAIGADGRGYAAFDHPGGGPYTAVVTYQPGDRLWVRETWKPHSIYSTMKPRDMPASKIFYRADDTYAPSNTPWRVSIHMPRRFSRLTLYVTAVKVERLQEIDGYDAYWEGVCKSKEGHDAGHPSYTIMEFERLWDTINSKPGTRWEDNPWVVAVTFEARQGNIDSLERAA